MSTINRWPNYDSHTSPTSFQASIVTIRLQRLKKLVAPLVCKIYVSTCAFSLEVVRQVFVPVRQFPAAAKSKPLQTCEDVTAMSPVRILAATTEYKSRLIIVSILGHLTIVTHITFICFSS